MERVTEADLVKPTIEIIAEHGHPDQGLSISEIAPRLREYLRPADEDLVQLDGRSDDRLSQVIRNLVSHRKLERLGLAVYSNRDSRKPGAYVLTEDGWNKAIAQI